MRKGENPVQLDASHTSSAMEGPVRFSKSEDFLHLDGSGQVNVLSLLLLYISLPTKRIGCDS